MAPSSELTNSGAAAFGPDALLRSERHELSGVQVGQIRVIDAIQHVAESVGLASLLGSEREIRLTRGRLTRA